MFFFKKKEKYKEMMTIDSNFYHENSWLLSHDKKMQFYLVCQQIKYLLENEAKILFKIIKENKEKIFQAKEIKQCILFNNEFLCFYLKNGEVYLFYPDFKRISLSIIDNKEEKIIWSN